MYLVATPLLSLWVTGERGGREERGVNEFQFPFFALVLYNHVIEFLAEVLLGGQRRVRESSL